MKLSKLFRAFFQNEKTSGVILIGCTVFSLWITNSDFSESYLHIWHYPMFGHTFEHWINDGLMAIFFLLVGLELGRSFFFGELSSVKKAGLPMAGALGGMIVPALIFTLFNYGTTTQSGAGIPMATDIAFAIGVLSLAGKLVPASLKIFLTALAVIDDLGAILVIAFFYTSSLSFLYLSLALAIFVLLLVLNKLKVYTLIPYLIGGVLMWYFMLHSGVHATITGVLLAFTIPFQNGKEDSLANKVEHFLQRPVMFIIMPLFALANTSIVIESNWYQHLFQNYSLGIFLGLVVGKPLGILSFSLLSIAIGWCAMPSGINWRHLLGAGMLGGIGFTMSIFITLLAFDNKLFIDGAKIAILISSTVAALIGYIYLSIILKK
jgi:Na+:H+ antiporter, NhaA family